MKINDFGPWRQFLSFNDRTDGAEAPILYYPVLDILVLFVLLWA